MLKCTTSPPLVGKKSVGIQDGLCLFRSLARLDRNTTSPTEKGSEIMVAAVSDIVAAVLLETPPRGVGNFVPLVGIYLPGPTLPARLK